MKPTQPHDHPTDLVTAYVLDALGDAEMAFVEDHLEGCAKCRAEVDGLRAVTAALLPASPAAPPTLRGRIMSGIASVP
ncbi:MAG: zf-HC2 domain-containing protein [Actinobacteria bacterium]|nr:zf-HC2 domain-containing protein [Actinomycetota bacterium]